MKKLLYLLSFISIFLFLGCAGKHINTADSVVIDKYKVSSESLYYLAKDDVSSHYPKTGFYPLQNNLDAFAARVCLIKAAKKTLDLQYFIFAEDQTAYFLTHMLIEAADRGVKVRILLDDLLKKDTDVELDALASHPNIEIKFFNPTTARKFMGWLQMAFNIDTLGRRMHNKLLVADNSAAIIGGRNIENIYFAADKDAIFIDNDVLAIGPLAAQATNEFETYWRNKISVSVHKLATNEDKADYQNLRKSLDEYIHSIEYNDYNKEASQRDFAKSAKKSEIPLFYGDAKLYFDIPSKITLSEDDTSTHLSKHIKPLLKNIKKSLKIINPYFIPNEKMMSELRELRQRGVEIYIVTNSLATNDGIPVYSAYSRYHRELIKLGVHLYELNPNSFSYIYKNQKYRRGSIPRSSLHAKNMLIDDEIFIIGSANLDPRSIKLNTEVVAVIHSKELAKVEAKVFKNITKPQNVFKLSLEDISPDDCDDVCKLVPHENTRVVWTTKQNGKEVKYYNDADAGFWRRFGSNLSTYIPLDKYL
jgi:putative cardiolipin synthase